MTKFSNILKKNLFLAHFPNFGSKNVFPENPALSRTTSHRILVPCQSSEETNDTNPRKRLDRRADGRTDGRTEGGQTLFLGPFRLPPEVQKG